MTVRSVRKTAGLMGLVRALLIVCLLAGGRAQAQPATATAAGSSGEPSEGTLDPQIAARRKEARERFVHGLSLAKMGACSTALVEFTASLKLFRTRAALTNSAVCLRELGRFVEARDAYASLLNDSASSTTSEERLVLEAELERLGAQIGEIRVESEPQGALVVVDAQQRGQTPLVSPVWVDAGTHRVRVFRPGFSSIETTVVVAGRQVSQVRAVLEPNRQQVGSLLVRETAGNVLNVVVNGAVMGQTPWQGALPPGSYSVLLQGTGDIGSAPNTAKVQANQTTTLVLNAGRLESEVRVEPTPSDSQVWIDGVSVGNGVWLGRLTSGAHRVEVRAEGYAPAQRTLTARPGEREVVHVTLARQVLDPWQSASALRRAYVEVNAGLGWAPSLGGSADEACAQSTSDLNEVPAPSCASESHPVGFLGGLRVGYFVAPRVGVEVYFGYLTLSEKITRRILADHEKQANVLYSADYRDTTQLAGPVAAISASYRFLERTPITLRAWLGVGRVKVETGNSGRFAGTVKVREVDTPINQILTVAEETQTVWLPFAGPELRAGYRLSASFEVDVGVAALLLLPGKTPRSGSWGKLSGDRRGPIIEPDTNANLDVYKLPDEQALGTALVLIPSLALRYRL